MLSVSSFVTGLVGMKCWHISCPWAMKPTFSLALGAAIPRKIPLPVMGIRHVASPSGNMKRRIVPLRSGTDKWHRFAGEGGLYVWTTWRLQSRRTPLASSSQEHGKYSRALKVLLGRTVSRITVDAVALDLRIWFTGGLEILVFADNLPERLHPLSNWTVHDVSRQLQAGPGRSWKFMSNV